MAPISVENLWFRALSSFKLSTVVITSSLRRVTTRSPGVRGMKLSWEYLVNHCLKESPWRPYLPKMVSSSNIVLNSLFGGLHQCELELCWTVGLLLIQLCAEFGNFFYLRFGFELGERINAEWGHEGGTRWAFEVDLGIKALEEGRCDSILTVWQTRVINWAVNQERVVTRNHKPALSDLAAPTAVAISATMLCPAFTPWDWRTLHSG